MNVFKESYKYCGRYMPAFVIGFFVGILGLVITMLLPQITQLILDFVVMPALGGDQAARYNNIFMFAINKFEPTDYFGKLIVLVVFLGAILLARYAIHYVRWNMVHAFGVRAERDMRIASFKKMLSQNTVVMNRYTSGELMSIANGDTVQIKDIYVHYVPMMLDQFIAIGIAIFFLTFINGLLMIIPLFFGLLTAIVTIFYIRDIRRAFSRIREKSAELNSVVMENINGVRIIRAFATEQKEINKFDIVNEAFKDSFIAQAKVVSKYQAIFATFGNIVNISSVILGIIFAVNGYITAGQFTTFLSYVFLINNPLINITHFVAALQNSVVSGTRFFTFLNTNNIIQDNEHSTLINGKPNIHVDNMFLTIDGKEILKDIEISIPYGKKLGIMGKTGSGKSAFIKCLPRFFEVTQGEILVNGNNIKNIKIENLREQFSYVMQDVFLFTNTIEGNIAFYDPDAPFELVEKVAEHACAKDFIERMPEKYDTIVGERGVGLSGGQKQRVSIARAFLKNAPIIMFDDSTSALDVETEKKILDNINTHYSDRTLIISSHRASSVIHCDEILYFEDGVIIERGTHDELIALGGKYAALYAAQEAKKMEALA